MWRGVTSTVVGKTRETPYLKFMPPLPPSTTSRVLEKSLPFTTIFLPELKYNFLSLPQLCFLLFHALDFTELLCFTEMLLAFKMGVKIFWTATLLLFFTAALSFGASQYFSFYQAALSFGTSQWFSFYRVVLSFGTSR